MTQPIFKPSGRVVCQFSCGAASAVATKLAIEKYDSVEIVYCDTGSEHEDNARFIQDCEAWFGQSVQVLRSKKYSNIYEVFESRRFIVSKDGAPCTGELKRKVGEEVWKPGDTEVFGYTVEEKQRVARWKKENNERIIECPLIDRHLTKNDCFGVLDRAGIELPRMYQLGFRNNNCIGCVKARDSIDYWKRVRKHFPEQFARTAKLERWLGITINRVTKNKVRTPIYLDQIEPGDPKANDPNIQCGLFCMAESESIRSEEEQEEPHPAVTGQAAETLDSFISNSEI